MIAISFLNERSIGLFLVGNHVLELVRAIQLKFEPFRLLYLEENCSLFVSKWRGNSKEFCVIWMGEEVIVDTVPFDGDDIFWNAGELWKMGVRKRNLLLMIKKARV